MRISLKTILKNRSVRKLALIVAVILLAAGYDFFQGKIQSTRESPSAEISDTPTAFSEKEPHVATLNKIRQAADSQRSGWWLTTQGHILKTLKDDTRGSQHQRFLLKLAPDITLLVAHNIDLAPRVPLKQGDSIKIRGRYEWNHKGGVLHWTHHDPKKRQKGGWIYYKNKYYQ